MKKSVKVLIAVLVVIAICWYICSMKHNGMPSDYKVAVVDVQYIVSNSSEVKALREEQENKVKELQAWLNEIKSEVEKQKTEKSKQAMLEKYNKEFTEKQQKLREDYTKKLQAIDSTITEIVEEEASNQGYDLIVSKGVVLTGGDDITDSISKKVK